MILRLGALGIVGGVFSVIGTVSLVVALALAYDLHRDRRTLVPATGVVVANDRSCRKGCSYRPVVEYVVNGGKYGITGTVGNATPLYAVGEAVTVLHSPLDPRDARLDAPGESGFGIAFGGGFFLVFGGLGFTFLALAWRRVAGARWARRFGLPVQADIVGVERDTRLKVNGRSPYRIVCQWLNPRDRKVYRFESDPMWVDPSAVLRSQKQISVRLDPDKPKHRYWMDVAFLPEAA